MNSPDEAKKMAFLVRAIQEYQNGERYKRAQLAQKYYKRENEAILKRLTYLQRNNVVNKSQIIFHKLCNGFFPKMCKQLSQYLLGNGVSIDSQYKQKLGVRFDKDIQTMGINTLVDGVNWGFWNVNHLQQYRATEFFTLVDEWNNIPMLGIHFWIVEKQAQGKFNNTKAMYVEVFDINGVTPYIVDNTGMKPMPGKSFIPYKTKIYSDELITQTLSTGSYEVLPVFPLYANEEQVSEFNDGLKSMIDAYDFINSDLADSITQTEGIYWAIKNYGGADAADLIKEIETFRATVNEEDSDVKNFAVETPYQAKQYALESLRKAMYQDQMILDLELIQGGSLTNVAINVAKTDFDLKTDTFEWQVGDFVQNILALVGVSNIEIKFKRRTITNDTETINNISTMMADGYLDVEGAIGYCPLIPEGDQQALLDRLLLQETGIPQADMTVDENEGIPLLQGGGEVDG